MKRCIIHSLNYIIAYICDKQPKNSCSVCWHFRWDEDRERFACFAEQDEKGGNSPAPTSTTKRKQPSKGKKVIGYLTLPHSNCANCINRKEHCPNVLPDDCKECVWLSERDEPYTVDVPVFEDPDDPDANTTSQH